MSSQTGQNRKAPAFTEPVGNWNDYARTSVAPSSIGAVAGMRAGSATRRGDIRPGGRRVASDIIATKANQQPGKVVRFDRPMRGHSQTGDGSGEPRLTHERLQQYAAAHALLTSTPKNAPPPHSSIGGGTMLLHKIPNLSALAVPAPPLRPGMPAAASPTSPNGFHTPGVLGGPAHSPAPAVATLAGGGVPGPRLISSAPVQPALGLPPGVRLAITPPPGVPLPGLGPPPVGPRPASARRPTSPTRVPLQLLQRLATFPQVPFAAAADAAPHEGGAGTPPPGVAFGQAGALGTGPGARGGPPPERAFGPRAAEYPSRTGLNSPHPPGVAVAVAPPAAWAMAAAQGHTRQPPRSPHPLQHAPPQPHPPAPRQSHPQQPQQQQQQQQQSRQRLEEPQQGTDREGNGSPGRSSIQEGPWAATGAAAASAQPPQELSQQAPRGPGGPGGEYSRGGDQHQHQHQQETWRGMPQGLQERQAAQGEIDLRVAAGPLPQDSGPAMQSVALQSQPLVSAPAQLPPHTLGDLLAEQHQHQHPQAPSPQPPAPAQGHYQHHHQQDHEAVPGLREQPPAWPLQPSRPPSRPWSAVQLQTRPRSRPQSSRPAAATAAAAAAVRASTPSLLPPEPQQPAPGSPHWQPGTPVVVGLREVPPSRLQAAHAHIHTHVHVQGQGQGEGQLLPPRAWWEGQGGWAALLAGRRGLQDDDAGTNASWWRGGAEAADSEASFPLTAVTDRPSGDQLTSSEAAQWLGRVAELEAEMKEEQEFRRRYEKELLMLAAAAATATGGRGGRLGPSGRQTSGGRVLTGARAAAAAVMRHRAGVPS